MAAATYTPPSFTKARSRLAVLTRTKSDATELTDARADMTVAQVMRVIDKAATDGAMLDDHHRAYINAYMARRLARPGA